jgi:hypothetical protein
LSIKLLKLTANLLQSTAELTTGFAGRLDQVGDTRRLQEAKINLIGRQCFVISTDIGCGCLGNILQNDELRETPEFPSSASPSSHGTEQFKRKSGRSTSSEQRYGNEEEA